MANRAHTVDRPQDHLTRREGQAIAVHAQGLATPPPRRRVTMADLREVVDRLGCVQIDTISVISRSHETVAWSRLGPYDVDLWEQLYEPEHAITEYWAHAAAIIPMDDLPLYRPEMERFRDVLRDKYADQQPIRDVVLRRIREDGPMGSRHFDAPDGAPAQAWDWYGRKPEREALADLWSEGALVLRRRDSFHRIFDAYDRLVPDLWAGEIDRDARDLVLARKAMRALGITTIGWFIDYFRTGGRHHLPRARAKEVLSCLVAREEAIPVTVAGIDEPLWLDPARIETLGLLRDRRGWPTRTTLLSPFDNLTWNRKRTIQLWQFDYRLECYVPASKRIYGYYTLPILYRGRLVGRLDPSFDRKAKLLTIKALHWEDDVQPSEAMSRAVSRSIGELCTFLGGDPDRWVVNGDASGIVTLATTADVKPAHA